MRIGVPKEIKDNEYRVGLIPSVVRELTERGHQVLVENDAGTGAGFSDADYRDAGATIVVVARFLALLELYREGAVSFEQAAALGELHVRWVGNADAEAELERWAHETGEHDEYDAVDAEESEQA